MDHPDIFGTTPKLLGAPDVKRGTRVMDHPGFVVATLAITAPGTLRAIPVRMMQLDHTDTSDDAADTLRFVRPAFEAPTDPDATSIYDLTPTPVRYVGRDRPSPRRRRQIRDTRENPLRLYEALAAGWDIAPELAHEERRLASLEAAA